VDDTARAYFDTFFGFARSRVGRATADARRMARREFDAVIGRAGVVSRAEFDDLGLRLEHTEDEVRELRRRLAEAEARAAEAAARADTEGNA
jgi:BMFP domain-containing protein YqiC